MELLAADENGVRTLRLLGNFEPADVPRFDALIDKAIADGHTRIVIDAAHVQLVCSAAVSAFLHAHTRLANEHGELVMAEMPHFAKVLFETLGLNRLIRCVATVDDGARALTVTD